MTELYQILLVEDNEGDMILTMEALEALNHQHVANSKLPPSMKPISI